MNSRCLLIIALCGLLMGQRQAWSANLGPQLLPLPTMAQGASEVNIPANEAQGEVQFVQPSITLTADKDIVQGVDPDEPPKQSNLTIAMDIVKKEPGKDQRVKVEKAVPILDKNGNKIGEKFVPSMVGANETSTTVIVVGTTKGGANQIKATYSLLPTIILAIMMISLL